MADLETRSSPAPRETATDAHLRRLAALGAADFGAGSLQGILSGAADLVERLLPADRGAAVILWDPLSDSFSTAATSIGGQTAATAGRLIHRGGGATRHIVDTAGAVLVGDVTEDPFGSGRSLADRDIRAYIGVPIADGARPLGVIYGLARQPRVWTGEDLEFLEVVARRAAAAIDAERVISAARQASERAEVIGHVAHALIAVADTDEAMETVTEGVIAGLDADGAYVATLDDERAAVDGLSVTLVGNMELPAYEELMDGLAGEAIRAGATVISSGSQADTREPEHLQRRRRDAAIGPMAVAPFDYQGRVRGVLVALRGAGREDFGGEDAGLLTVLAGQVATAIGSIRLRQETEEALAELGAVFEIVKAQNTEGDLDNLLVALTSAAATALSVEEVMLVLADLDERAIRRIVWGGVAAPSPAPRLSFRDVSRGMAGWVMRHRRPFVANIPEEAPGVTPAGPALAVPLFNRGEIQGALVATSHDRTHHFSARDIEMAALVTGQMSIAIANAELLAETKRLATIDDLTGVANRRHLFDLGDQLFASAERYERDLAALMFDIDRFKHVNDTYGHAVGDEVLCAVAERARATLREPDLLGRYGGEEFAVVLPETDLEGAVEIAERLRATMAERPIATAGGSIPITVSVGVAAVSPEIEDLHGLLDRADAAMLFAKRLGRNRVKAG